MQSTAKSEKGTFAMGRSCYSQIELQQGFGSSDFRELDTLDKIQFLESFRKPH